MGSSRPGEPLRTPNTIVILATSLPLSTRVLVESKAKSHAKRGLSQMAIRGDQLEMPGGLCHAGARWTEGIPARKVFPIRIDKSA